MLNYSGYIYLWYDTRSKLFYLGGHKGKVEDSYVCSSKRMMQSYTKRPNTFRFRVLEYVYGDNTILRQTEQKWLNKIKNEELYWSSNIWNGTVRYYNQKKTSAGGNGSANKGKSHPPWNKGLKGVQDYSNPLHRKKRSDSAKKRWAKIKASKLLR